MPIPHTRAQGLNEFMIAELRRLPPPFYGVNVIDVANMSLFAERMEPVRAWLTSLNGFRPHFRTTADYGNLQRILVVNLYGAELAVGQLHAVLDDPQFSRDAIAAIESAEAWDFFTAPQV